MRLLAGGSALQSMPWLTQAAASKSIKKILIMRPTSESVFEPSYHIFQKMPDFFEKIFGITPFYGGAHRECESTTETAGSDRSLSMRRLARNDVRTEACHPHKH